MTATHPTPPAGLYGLSIAPWSPSEIYAVVANWGQASAPIYYWGDGEWVAWGRQVADFRHEPEAALAEMLRETLRESGESGDEAEELVADAEEI